VDDPNAVGRASGNERWLYLSGLRYDALYRQREWLRDFLDSASARSTLFRWRFSTLAVGVVLVGAVTGLVAGWLIAFVLGVAALVLVGIGLWLAAPGIVTREQVSKDPLWIQRSYDACESGIAVSRVGSRVELASHCPALAAVDRARIRVRRGRDVNISKLAHFADG
jgi:hypothetical protein